jgi:hypothetical protein
MKLRIATIGLTLGCLGGASLFLLNPNRIVSADNDPELVGERVRVGLRIAPVNLNLQGRNVALVGLGSYIVNAQGACADCHSCPTYTPGHNPYPPPLGVSGDGQINGDNYLAGGVPFAVPGGTVLSANLTPDSNGLPGGMTVAKFFDAIRLGHDPMDPSQTLVVMPWPQFRKMTNSDLTAIYEYLRAIPAAQPGSCVAPGQ